MENKENTKNIKPKKVNKNAHAYKMCFIIITITLIFVLISVFAIGKTVAGGSSEELKIEFYTYLNDNNLGWLSSLLFGDEVPSYGSLLPPSKDSDSAKVSILFSGSEDVSVKKISFTSDKDGFDGVMLAISDPTRLSIGSSTQKSNVLSGIMNVEHADLAFSFADAGKDTVLVSDGVTQQGVPERCGYFGFTSEGVLHFGNTDIKKIEELSLEYATLQDVHSLIVGGVPCDFETSKGELGTPSFSVAQCADGSIMLLFLDRNASCREITELLYRYSAINAAIIYTGECVGFVDGEGAVSFGESFDTAEYACAWVLK